MDNYSIVWLIIIVVGLVLRFAGKIGKSGAKKSTSSNRTTAQTPVRSTSAQARTAARPVSVVTAHHSKGKDCEYGDVNHQYSHDQQRRLQQLDSFLKNGIIDKEEYQVLYNKYTKGE